MKNIMIAAVLAGMSVTGYAADFTDLQNFKASDAGTKETYNAVNLEATELPVAARTTVGQLAQSGGKSCFTLSGQGVPSMPAEFCVAGLSLEKLSGGDLNMALFSDNQAIKGGKAVYVSRDGADYASVNIFLHYDGIYFGDIVMLAPVYPSGGLVPGAEIKVEARASFSPPGSHQQFQLDAKYSKAPASGPLQTDGICYIRPVQELAASVGLPVKFCIAGILLERNSSGTMKLAVGGDLAGKFMANYVHKNGAAYVQAQIFLRDNGFVSVDRGSIDILVPALPNGALNLEGKIVVDAKTGHNDNIHYSGWEYQAVQYTTVN